MSPCPVEIRLRGDLDKLAERRISTARGHLIQCTLRTRSAGEANDQVADRKVLRSIANPRSLVVPESFAVKSEATKVIRSSGPQALDCGLTYL